MKTMKDSYDADNATGINHEGPRANMPVRRLTATSIIGDDVENRVGEKLGTIDNLMINIDSGEIEYAVLEFGDFAGIGGKLFAVPFGELTVQPDKKVFILDRDKEYLKKSPGFEKTHWPDTNDRGTSRYFEDVTTYYRPVFPFPFD
ncbi:PRC-barrel domain-containing protein [Dawidia soli]|uniref:PRC-barrel domain-containing protein n=1 Tax=Dawidia soli TaxID=2782352 RepID=A0AAP2DE11_9BACT|nr:PRC-barrel domain-containing protein [Dawidia soli]MBT1690303.1 PRC-barrel domain-containing protein [Dawidia soli]